MKMADKRYRCSLCGYKSTKPEGITNHALAFHKQPERVEVIDRHATTDSASQTEGEYEAGRIYGIAI
jgi:predicted ATP-dependent serine protease